MASAGTVFLILFVISLFPVAAWLAYKYCTNGMPKVVCDDTESAIKTSTAARRRTSNPLAPIEHDGVSDLKLTSMIRFLSSMHSVVRRLSRLA
jgi:hypothetical protein